jgi:hypothetical protein
MENGILIAFLPGITDGNFESGQRVSANQILSEIGQRDYLDTLLATISSGWRRPVESGKNSCRHGFWMLIAAQSVAQHRALLNEKLKYTIKRSCGNHRRPRTPLHAGALVQNCSPMSCSRSTACICRSIARASPMRAKASISTYRHWPPGWGLRQQR